MIGETRDIVALIALDQRLSLLRERQLEMMLRGERIPVDFWTAGQREIAEYIRGRFYNQQLRVMAFGEAQRDKSDDQGIPGTDPEARRYGILLTHRRSLPRRASGTCLARRLMEFTNATVLPAALARGSTGDREMVGVVAAKLTCRVEDDRLVRSPEEDWWPVFEQPHLFEGVTLGAEMDFRKRAADILVFGRAMAPRGEPVRQMRLGIHCGTVRFEIDVIGDRHWLDTKDGPIPSDPTPFLSMPLTHDRAFGGKRF